MRKPEICGVIVDKQAMMASDSYDLPDLYEIRIDLIGNDWQEIIPRLNKPWIACNRPQSEGGKWTGEEKQRINELLRAAELGAGIVDIELNTPGLSSIVPLIKKRSKCLLSFHDFNKTPPLNELKAIVRKQIAAGADMLKVVTTANDFIDNSIVLELIRQFPRKKLTAFAMGHMGWPSRILSPLLGNGFAYASLAANMESAPGQIRYIELRKIYNMLAAIK